MELREASRRVREEHQTQTAQHGVEAPSIETERLPSLAESVARTFALDEEKLQILFGQAGFQDVEITTEARRFVLPSFDAYFEPFEQGGGSSGQVYLQLPETERRAVREEVRQNVGDTGGAISINVALRFASGRR